MNRLIAVLVVLALSMVPTLASAIDLRNEDMRPYTVQVHSTAMTKDLEVKGRSMSIIVCVGQCTFFVPGIGRVTAEGSDVITIRNGRLMRVPAPQIAQP